MTAWKASGSTAPGELGRSLHVDEEHGHFLALAPERASLGQNALGEVARRVGGGSANEGGRDGRGDGPVGAERRAAGVAESRLGSLALAAGRAPHLDGGAAAVAEAGARAEVMAARGAVHAWRATINRRVAPCWPPW